MSNSWRKKNSTRSRKQQQLEEEYTRLSKIVQETTEETETYVGDLEEDKNRVAGREQCREACDKKEQLADVENCVK